VYNRGISRIIFAKIPFLNEEEPIPTCQVTANGVVSSIPRASSTHSAASYLPVSPATSLSAKRGGGNPDANITLRAAVQRAREASMPQDNIKRAIARGVGGEEGANYENLTYEGYGPGGVAILVDCLTDNKQRTVSDVRSYFNKNGGRLAESGSVAYLFTAKGVILIDPDVSNEEAVTEAAIEGGAEDIQPTGDGGFEITTAPSDLVAVQQALANAKIAYASAEQSMIPVTTVSIVGKEATQILRLVDQLEEHDDVQTVYANFDIPEAELEKLEAGR
jgi:YebC/PmpR family DNA-binding regulatory protein